MDNKINNSDNNNNNNNNRKDLIMRTYPLCRALKAQKTQNT